MFGWLQAVTVVHHLLRGREDDSGVLDDLAELLAAEPEEDIVLLSQGKCTGRAHALPPAVVHTPHVYVRRFQPVAL